MPAKTKKERVSPYKGTKAAGQYNVPTLADLTNFAGSVLAHAARVFAIATAWVDVRSLNAPIADLSADDVNITPMLNPLLSTPKTTYIKDALDNADPATREDVAGSMRGYSVPPNGALDDTVNGKGAGASFNGKRVIIVNPVPLASDTIKWLCTMAHALKKAEVGDVKGSGKLLADWAASFGLSKVKGTSNVYTIDEEKMSKDLLDDIRDAAAFIGEPVFDAKALRVAFTGGANQRVKVGCPLQGATLADGKPDTAARKYAKKHGNWTVIKSMVASMVGENASYVGLNADGKVTAIKPICRECALNGAISPLAVLLDVPRKGNAAETDADTASETDVNTALPTVDGAESEIIEAIKTGTSKAA